MKNKKFSNVDDLVSDLLGEDDAPAFVDGMHAHRQATATISELVLNRVKQRLTQREVARRMGVSPSKVCRMEDSVDADLSYDDIQKYSDALGLRSTVVFEMKGQPRDIASYVYSIGTQLEQLKGLLPSSSGFCEKLTSIYGNVLFPMMMKNRIKTKRMPKGLAMTALAVMLTLNAFAGWFSKCVLKDKIGYCEMCHSCNVICPCDGKGNCAPYCDDCHARSVRFLTNYSSQEKLMRMFCVHVFSQ